MSTFTRKLILLFVLIVSTVVVAMAQDKITLHDGEILNVSVISLDQSTIKYKFPNENPERVIGKLAVVKIEYASGRTENISSRVVIGSEKDWEKVQIVTDKSLFIGMKEGKEITSQKSGWFNYNSQKGIDKKVERKIKETAASYNAPYILLTDEEKGRVVRSLKKGVLYTYPDKVSE